MYRAAQQRNAQARKKRSNSRSRRKRVGARGLRGTIYGLIGGMFDADELGDGELPRDPYEDMPPEAIDAMADGLQLPIPRHARRKPVAPGAAERDKNLRRIFEDATKQERAIEREASRIESIGPPAPKPVPPPSGSARGSNVRQRARQIAQQALGNPANLLALLDRRQKSPRTNITFPAAAPINIAAPVVNVPEAPGLPPGLTAPGFQLAPGLTAFDSTRVGSASHQCSCKSKRKSERRKCKERATVKWAGGRKKGQTAGTKCVAYYN